MKVLFRRKIEKGEKNKKGFNISIIFSIFFFICTIHIFIHHHHHHLNKSFTSFFFSLFDKLTMYYLVFSYCFVVFVCNQGQKKKQFLVILVWHTKIFLAFCVAFFLYKSGLWGKLSCNKGILKIWLIEYHVQGVVVNIEGEIEPCEHLLLL